MKRENLFGAACTAVLCAGLVACGGGGGGVGRLPGHATGEERVAIGTIANYLDADWLFTQYLERHGVPAESKPSYMPGLKLLANGFTLQLNSGQDVQANIEQVHAAVMRYAASSEGVEFFAKARKGSTESVPSTPGYDPGRPPDMTVPEPYISSEQRVAIAAAKERHLQEDREVLETAKKYRLPYRVEGPNQWFIYTPKMKQGGKGGWRGGNGSSDSDKHPDVRSWGWRPGDVVWVNGTGSVAGVPGHVAIAWGGRDSVEFVDANTDVGVSTHSDVQQWADRYTEVHAMTPRLNWSEAEFVCYRDYGSVYGCAADSWQRMRAWAYAKSNVGAAYNWNFSLPADEGRFYCSSLVWQAYMKADYNIVWPKVVRSRDIVFPSDFRDSRVLTTFRVSRL